MTAGGHPRPTPVLRPVRPRRRRGLRNALLLLGVLVAVFAFLRSPVFTVSEIEITGLKWLTADQVIAWSGLQGSFWIWQVDTEQVARRLREHPRVLGAEVERRWPNRLVVRLMERTPVAVVRYHDLWVLVDDSGVAMALEQERPEGLPELRGIELQQVGLGQPLPGDLPLAARCAGYRRQYGLDWIERIEVTPEGLVLTLSGGVPAYFGRVSDEPDRKLAVLNSLWTSWRDQLHEVAFFDVRHPERPVVQTHLRQQTPTSAEGDG